MPLSSAESLVANSKSSADRRIGQITAWQVLDYTNLYRLTLSVFFVGLFFAPDLLKILPDYPGTASRSVSIVYLVWATALFLAGRKHILDVHVWALAGGAGDIAALLVLMEALGGLDSGVPVALVGTIAGVSVLLPRRLAIAFAAVSSVAILTSFSYGAYQGLEPLRNAPAAGLYGLVFFAVALIANYLARRITESQELAERRGVDLANLAQLNELVIQRMRTGVLVVDSAENIRLMNESAWYMIGMPPSRRGLLSELVPLLDKRWRQWQFDRIQRSDSVALAEGVPQVVPRFAPLGENEGSTLVFLEDSSLIARRAEEITLTSLARLSSSIAHEIRNPLAAISHAGQLLEESDALIEADRRLAAIVRTHCQRMNDIIENVLTISRRETSQPEDLDVGAWSQRFVDEYLQTHALDEGSTLVFSGSEAPVMASIDQRHLHQVVWNLVQNALRYGRHPGRPANVQIIAGLTQAGSPLLEVVDDGPGIVPSLRRRIFEPFFTTSDSGTGIGLYISSQMCEANGATLEYQAPEEGGSRFRIIMRGSETALRRGPVPVDDAQSDPGLGS